MGVRYTACPYFIGLTASAYMATVYVVYGRDSHSNDVTDDLHEEMLVEYSRD